MYKYSNEAIELLRKCHGQFLSLISSELASGERIEKKKKPKDSTSDFTYTDDDGPAMRSIVAQNVMNALENLDFHYISQSLMKPSHGQNKKEKKGGNALHSKTKATPKGKKKKRLKKSILTAELLEEQEKLLALSAARAKQSIENM